MCHNSKPATEKGKDSSRPVELADIFGAHGPQYRQTHNLAPVQHRAMRAVESCRTAALGGHKETCEACGAARISYNSCRNRHCPKCQTLAKQRWLESRRTELLPVEYFHVVFTLPHELNPLAQGNPRQIYNLLFQAAADTLSTFSRDPRRLSGEMGVTAVLHTWGQNLSQHLHLHCVVTGGALAADGSRWIAAKKGFLFPVRALSRVFRGKYLHALRRAFDGQQLSFSGGLSELADAEKFADLLRQLRKREWVVYAKPPFAGPEKALEYLARYTHRVAISNERLVKFEQGVVRVRWRDYADRNKVKLMDLEAEEFIRRFLLHVLPDGFVRLRHFGILANRCRKAKLERCRTLLGQTPQPPDTEKESIEAMMLRLTGIDIHLCPVCRLGYMLVTEILAPQVPRDHRPRPLDSS